MPRTELEEALDLVLEETAKKVAALGFRRRGMLLRTASQGNAGLIEFQKSTRESECFCLAGSINGGRLKLAWMLVCSRTKFLI